MNRYIIGINTGGTYTDGVLLDYDSRKVITAAKSLTTNKDLKIGVIKVLKKLNIRKEYDIKLVGISSTLATNTVAEGKTRKAGLILLGYDKELIDKFNLSERLPAETLAYFRGGHNAQGVELASLDKRSVREWVVKNQHNIEAVAVSGYFSPLNPGHEEAVFKIIRKHTELPVVMAHQLSTKLDSVKRAATAVINASLVAVMKEFIQAVYHSMDELGIDAPLMILRGDGTLMPSMDAVSKPVETILSGPAASAIGGRFLADNGNALVIDIGGTTTDMALVKNNKVIVSENGAKVGNYQTAIETAKIRTISLRCDSRIHLNEKNELLLGPDRTRPISQIARHHNNVLNEIHNLKNKTIINKNPAEIEYWYLHGTIENNVYESLNDTQKKVLELIQQPHKLSSILKKTGVYHVAQLQMDNFISQNIIECSTLTPTDLLHVDRSLDLWDREVATIALEHYCKIYNKQPKSFIEEVFNKIADVLVEEIIIFLACQNMNPSDMPASVDGEWGKWMLQQILYGDNHLLSIDADSRYPVVGVGSPAKHFLKRVAGIVKAKLILPENFDVANAVGAVSGSVSEVREAIVFVRDSKEKYAYVTKHEGKIKEFKEYVECCEYAEKSARRIAKKAVMDRGAADCFVELERKVEGSLIRFVARAIGNPKLSKNNMRAGINYEKEIKS